MLALGRFKWGLEIAARCTFGETMRLAQVTSVRYNASLRELLTSVVREAEEFGLAEPDPVRPGRPRRILAPPRRDRAPGAHPRGLDRASPGRRRRGC